jgi:hypothetical protein
MTQSLASLICSGLLLPTVVVFAADMRSPKETVDFYLEAQKQQRLDEMARVRHFEVQARELLRARGASSEPQFKAWLEENAVPYRTMVQEDGEYVVWEEVDAERARARAHDNPSVSLRR